MAKKPHWLNQYEKESIESFQRLTAFLGLVTNNGSKLQRGGTALIRRWYADKREEILGKKEQLAEMSKQSASTNEFLKKLEDIK